MQVLIDNNETAKRRKMKGRGVRYVDGMGETGQGDVCAWAINSTYLTKYDERTVWHFPSRGPGGGMVL